MPSEEETQRQQIQQRVRDIVSDPEVAQKYLSRVEEMARQLDKEGINAHDSFSEYDMMACLIAIPTILGDIVGLLSPDQVEGLSLILGMAYRIGIKQGREMDKLSDAYDEVDI